MWEKKFNFIFFPKQFDVFQQISHKLSDIKIQPNKRYYDYQLSWVSYLTDNHSKEDQIHIYFWTKISDALLVLMMITKKTIWYIKIMASEIGETAFCTYIMPEPH